MEGCSTTGSVVRCILPAIMWCPYTSETQHRVLPISIPSGFSGISPVQKVPSGPDASEGPGSGIEVGSSDIL